MTVKRPLGTRDMTMVLGCATGGVFPGHPPAGVPPCLTRMRACHTMRACVNAGQVVAYDFGIKHNILRRLASYGCKITVVPSTTAPEEVMALNPDGVLFRGEGGGEGVGGGGWRGRRDGGTEGGTEGGKEREGGRGRDGEGGRREPEWQCRMNGKYQ